jgi:predicted TIM-barrel fold metal-dependent hydrolase
VTVVDLWVNALSAGVAAAFVAEEANSGIEALFGTDLGAGSPMGDLLATMDRCGVDVGVVTTGLSDPRLDALLEAARESDGRLVVAAVADRPAKPVEQVAALRDAAAHPLLRLVRVTPLVDQYPLNHRLYYPLYACCAELGLPVSINVGVPGPRVRSACQHPELLEDVLIDFPQLVVIGAHMGHPYEALLVQYMLKWPRLYLSNSAYLARYMDPGLVSFMGSSRGRGRVLFASDHPFLPLDRAVAAARELPLDPASMEEFLGGAAARILGL